VISPEPRHVMVEEDLSDQLGPAPCPGFLEDRLEVVLDGVRRDLKRRGDLLGGEPLALLVGRSSSPRTSISRLVTRGSFFVSTREATRSRSQRFQASGAEWVAAGFGSLWVRAADRVFRLKAS
jgi:hypothetical protein